MLNTSNVANMYVRWTDPVSLATLEECKQLENEPNAKGFRNIVDLIAELEKDDD
jgi:hypothetical protein